MNDLRKRLQRLGVTKGRDFTPAPNKKQRGPDIDTLIDGDFIATPHGTAFTISIPYASDQTHAGIRIDDWLSLDPQTLAHLAPDPDLADLDPRHALFLDSETTGLGGGAFAFQVGIAFFDETTNLIVQQFFLRDPAEEKAMLHLLAERMRGDTFLVTFNGRSFDAPLMGDRFTRNRMPSRILSLPNLDLLMPARRLWKRRLPSCALGSLEVDILGLKRTAEDVPGYLIPALYNEYLRTGDATQMHRILYHNQQDLVSMLSLGVILARAFEQPDHADHPFEDRISLARWYANTGLAEACEIAYRMACDEAPDAESRYDALTGLARLLKRAERREEALPLWQDVADLKLDVLGHEELAKHYEWHNISLPTALQWTEGGIAVANSWRPGFQQRQALVALEHRRDRLIRKLNGEIIPADED